MFHLITESNTVSTGHMVESEEKCTIQFTVTDKNVKRKQLSGW